MLAHARDFRVIELRAHGDDEVIVRERERHGAVSRTQRDRARHGIDGFYVPRVKKGLRRHAPDRRDDVIQFDRSGDDLGQ